MNLNKLKEAARKFEQKEEWRRAIEIYLKAIQELGSGSEAIDPSLYNRVGDLEMKAGDSGAALRAYEQGAETYAEQGFYNNAIAVCGKILRVNPGRTHTYLRLAQLHARKNVVTEAKRNLLEFVERMHAAHQLDEAFQSVKAFADQFSGNQEIRLMLSELLRASSRSDEAREQLERLALDFEARGDESGARKTRERLHAIDAGEGQSPASASASPTDLIFLDTGVTSSAVDGIEFEPPPTDPLAGLDPTVLVPDDTPFTSSDGTPMEGVEPTIAELNAADPTNPLEGLESTVLDLPDTVEWSTSDPALEAITLDPAFEGDDLPLLATGFSSDAVDSELGYVGREGDSLGETPAFEIDLDDALPPITRRPLSVVPVPHTEDAPFDALEDEPSAVPPDPQEYLVRGHALFEVGDRAGGMAALEGALDLFTTAGRWEDALSTIDDLIRLDPDEVGRYQARVEIAYRSGERTHLVRSYLELGDALMRIEALSSALTVYTRVLEHDPENPTARAALATLAPRDPSHPTNQTPRTPAEPPPTAPAGDFVDLGALILDREPVRDTRMRVEAEAPVGDEDQDFLETLAQFKRGIEANIDSEDFQAHNDLGIAFKEMGLLDEAIAQFQKALRTPDVRLRASASEALGVAFFEKGRLAIAEAVLRRAVDSLPSGDDEKIGLVYWLGRALEGQERYPEALRCYERALAVDIRFLDLGVRMSRLAGEGV